METIKKILKEHRIILLVAVIFVVLYGYKQIHVTDYVDVSQSKVEKMLSNKKSFILVIGDDEYTDAEEEAEEEDYTSATSEQNLYIEQYIEDYHQKVYYLSSDDCSDLDALVEELGCKYTSLPQTYFIIDGEVYRSREDTVKYYEFSKLVTDWKDKK